MSEPGVALAFGVAAVATVAVAPLAARLAPRLGLVDHPGPRKIHARPIPLLGGAAVAAGVAFGAVSASARIEPAIAAAALLVFLTGLADDARKDRLSPWVRLAIESVAAAIAVAAGGARAGIFTSPPLDGALTGFFLVLAANALNLSDNMNGLASGIAFTAAGALAIAMAGADPGAAALLAGIAGAAAGFLPFNWPSARLFLGDAGALGLGFAIPAVALSARGSGPASSAFGAIVVALGLPLADTLFVSASRWRRGVPVFAGDRRHVSHRWAALGLGRAGAVASLVAVSAVLGGLAVAVARGRSAAIAAGAALLMLALALAVAARSPRGLEDERR